MTRGSRGRPTTRLDPSWRPSGQRVASLEPEEWDERTRRLLAPTLDRVAALEGGDAPNPRPLHILTTIANHSALLEPLLQLMTALAVNGELPRRESELLALRAAWNCRSDFEWGHHRVYGLAAGLREEEIAAIAAEPDAASWSPVERALLSAADQLHAEQKIDDATWSLLADHYTAAQLVELLFVVGQYTHLSMLANACHIQLEPHLEGLPND